MAAGDEVGTVVIGGMVPGLLGVVVDPFIVDMASPGCPEGMLDIDGIDCAGSVDGVDGIDGIDCIEPTVGEVA